MVFFTSGVQYIRCTSEVKTFGGHVEISFADALLAADCNSKRRSMARWGAQGFEVVGRRLGELAAVDGADVEDLPATVVEQGEDGAVIVIFDRGRLTVNAMPINGRGPTNDIKSANGLRIVSLILGDLA